MSTWARANFYTTSVMLYSVLSNMPELLSDLFPDIMAHDVTPRGSSTTLRGLLSRLPSTSRLPTIPENFIE